MEIEVFVHGALCIAYSGRCLLSGYFNHRDANQGTCTNSCRWDYKIAREDLDAVAEIPLAEIKRHPRADEVYYLEERERPGEFMPIFEDEHGTYIMNSRDLRAVEHVHRLAEIGVDCLKIEGRTKSHYYTARTTQVYRQAIDDAAGRATLQPGAAGRTGKSRQPRLHRRFFSASRKPGDAELPSGCLEQHTLAVRRRGYR